MLANEGKHLDPDGAYLALVASRDDVAIASELERLDALQAFDGSDEALASYKGKYGICGVRSFSARSEDGERHAEIYRLEIETFPRHVNNVYAICSVHEERPFYLLFDVGSGLPSSQRDLDLAFAVMTTMFGRPFSLAEVDECVVSHAHSDHCGGVTILKETTRAKLAVHELDARVIDGFEERVVLVTKDLEVFWRRAGVPAEQRGFMRDMYLAGKQLFRSVPIDRLLRDGDVVGPGFVVHHVPGHCPGLVCLQVYDTLLTSDHVLSRITPHQFPQSITPFAGLEHYFRSLAKIRALGGIRVAWGGHEEPITDLRTRIDEIEAFHRERLDRVLAICARPCTVHDVAIALFGERSGYDVILAVDEAGAHVEYLHQVGKLRVHNLAEVEAAEGDPVFKYQTKSAVPAPAA